MPVATCEAVGVVRRCGASARGAIKVCNPSVVVDVWCTFAVDVRHCHIAATPAKAIIRRVSRRNDEYDGRFHSAPRSCDLWHIVSPLVLSRVVAGLFRDPDFRRPIAAIPPALSCGLSDFKAERAQAARMCPPPVIDPCGQAPQPGAKASASSAASTAPCDQEIGD